MKKLKILFRADAGATTGTGHVYECLWLAASAKSECLFLIGGDGKTGERLVRRHRFGLRVIPPNRGRAYECSRMSAVIRKFKPDIIVFDLPWISQSYLDRIDAAGARLVMLNAVFHPVKAAVQITTVFLPLARNKEFFGPKYILLRKAFTEERPKRVAKEVRNVFALFGGADRNGFTLKALKALAEVDRAITVTVILGGAFSGVRAVRALLARLGKPSRLFLDIKNDHSLVEIMKSSDLAIASGGYTISELMRLGIPVIALAQNRIEEKKIFPIFPPDAFLNLGRGRNVSAHSLTKHIEKLAADFPRRARMNRIAAKVVDGGGIDRVLEIIKGLKHC